MQGTIAPTDFGWYSFLRDHPQLDEVNFWTPSAHRAFRAGPFAPFLFKLKAPHSAVCGYGFFASHARLPDWLAWECFGIGNGCADLDEMRRRIATIRKRMKYRGDQPANQIGCILIVQPMFFAEDEWVPQPRDWPVRSLTPVTRPLTDPEWARVWRECQERRAMTVAAREQTARRGAPVLVQPRLGQGTFRVLVTEAYGRACSVTGEHSLPALEAAHIRPFAREGPHEVSNGLLLRADLHRLFDQGYLTVGPDHRLEVGRRLREDYDNGHSYYPLHGTRLQLPQDRRLWPAPAFLEYHNREMFRG
jgi:putative restriction endonuclease